MKARELKALIWDVEQEETTFFQELHDAGIVLVRTDQQKKKTLRRV